MCTGLRPAPLRLRRSLGVGRHGPAKLTCGVSEPIGKLRERVDSHVRGIDIRREVVDSHLRGTGIRRKVVDSLSQGTGIRREVVDPHGG